MWDGLEPAAQGTGTAVIIFLAGVLGVVIVIFVVRTIWQHLRG